MAVLSVSSRRFMSKLQQISSIHRCCFLSNAAAAAAAAAASFSTDTASEDELKAMYEKYLIDFGKTDFIKTPEEKEKRFEIFKENLKYIKRYNSTLPIDKLGLTSVADYFPEELGGLVISAEELSTGPLTPTLDNDNLLPAYLRFPQKHPLPVFKEADLWKSYVPEDEQNQVVDSAAATATGTYLCLYFLFGYVFRYLISYVI